MASSYLGTLVGATPTDYTRASGGKPLVTDPAAAAKAALQANLNNLGTSKDLASRINKFNLGEVTKQYTAGIPNYKQMAGQSSSNIMAALQGEVPADVLAQMQNSAAERGLAMGAPGSSNANAAYLRALGLTSLGQQKYGEEALTGAVARMPKTAIYDVTKGFVTPEDVSTAQNQANLYAAAPVPQDAYAQALAAAKAGQSSGFGGARSPVGDIAAKYGGGMGFQAVPGTGSYGPSGVAGGGGHGTGEGLIYGGAVGVPLPENWNYGANGYPQFAPQGSYAQDAMYDPITGYPTEVTPVEDPMAGWSENWGDTGLPTFGNYDQLM